MVRKSGKLFRLDVIFRLALGLHPARTRCTSQLTDQRAPFSRETRCTPRSSRCARPTAHDNKLLLSGRVVGGGDVHVTFVAGDVRERLAIQETGGHAAKVAPNVDGGAGLHLGTEGGVCAVQAASGSKIAFGCTKNLA